MHLLKEELCQIMEENSEVSGDRSSLYTNSKQTNSRLKIISAKKTPRMNERNQNVGSVTSDQMY